MTHFDFMREKNVLSDISAQIICGIENWLLLQRSLWCVFNVCFLFSLVIMPILHLEIFYYKKTFDKGIKK